MCRWILKNLGDDLTEADIDDMIADVDTDGSGWVDYNGQCFTFHSLSFALTNHVTAGVIVLHELGPMHRLLVISLAIWSVACTISFRCQLAIIC